jgi:hypothetical protein
LPTQYLVRLGDRAIPILRYVEKAVHPRWPLAFDGHYGSIADCRVASNPDPFSNIPPAVLVMLISRKTDFCSASPFLAHSS